MTFRILVMLAVLVVVGAGGMVFAHDSRPLYVEMTERPGDSFAVGWKMPPVVGADNVPRVRLDAPCELQGAGRDGQASQKLEGQAIYLCSSEASPLALRIDYPKGSPSISTLLRVSWLSGQMATILADPGQVDIPVPDKETASAVGLQYLILGVEHILLGYDHLLFVLCLMVIAAGWRRLLWTVTGFTLAHSVTLVLAALDIVRLPVAAVEAVIVLSIVFLAAELVRQNKSSLTWRYPGAVAVAFGLVHGLGFAAVLTDIGLPQVETVAALFAFNIGVEIGQVVFICGVLLVFGLLRKGLPILARSLENIEATERRVGYGVGILASYWLVSRLSFLV